MERAQRGAPRRRHRPTTTQMPHEVIYARNHATTHLPTTHPPGGCCALGVHCPLLLHQPENDDDDNNNNNNNNKNNNNTNKKNSFPVLCAPPHVPRFPCLEFEARSSPDVLSSRATAVMNSLDRPHLPPRSSSVLGNFTLPKAQSRFDFFQTGSPPFYHRIIPHISLSFSLSPFLLLLRLPTNNPRAKRTECRDPPIIRKGRRWDAQDEWNGLRGSRVHAAREDEGAQCQ